MTPERITDDSLNGVSHGFFTRNGGVSNGIYDSLNCGPGSLDDGQAVRVNRARVAQEMGVSERNLVSLHQIHSRVVLNVTEPFTGPNPQADAMVTATPGVALAVLSADCQPVLFADAQALVVGAAHAGWKGALAGVLEATVAAMENLGAERSRISAVIGPCISQAAYEVGPEFRDAFLQQDPESEGFFGPGAGKKYQFDLPGYGLKRLQRLGLHRARWTGHCTYGNPQRFFSYRRGQHLGETDYGRLVAAIRL